MVVSLSAVRLGFLLISFLVVGYISVKVGLVFTLWCERIGCCVFDCDCDCLLCFVCVF